MLALLFAAKDQLDADGFGLVVDMEGVLDGGGGEGALEVGGELAVGEVVHDGALVEDGAFGHLPGGEDHGAELAGDVFDSEAAHGVDGAGIDGDGVGDGGVGAVDRRGEGGLGADVAGVVILAGEGVKGLLEAAEVGGIAGMQAGEAVEVGLGDGCARGELDGGDAELGAGDDGGAERDMDGAGDEVGRGLDGSLRNGVDRAVEEAAVAALGEQGGLDEIGAAVVVVGLAGELGGGVLEGGSGFRVGGGVVELDGTDEDVGDVDAEAHGGDGLDFGVGEGDGLDGGLEALGGEHVLEGETDAGEEGSVGGDFALEERELGVELGVERGAGREGEVDEAHGEELRGWGEGEDERGAGEVVVDVVEEAGVEEELGVGADLVEGEGLAGMKLDGG